MLDVSRHFIPLDAIKTTIRGMGASKLNTLHLHISDTAAFPLHTPSVPNVTAYGAISQEQSYSVVRLREVSLFF